jgi:hypothetical protein
MMEAVRASETLFYLNETTQSYIPEGCHIHTRRRENLKSRRHECIPFNRIELESKQQG